MGRKSLKIGKGILLMNWGNTVLVGIKSNKCQLTRKIYLRNFPAGKTDFFLQGMD